MLAWKLLKATLTLVLLRASLVWLVGCFAFFFLVPFAEWDSKIREKGEILNYSPEENQKAGGTCWFKYLDIKQYSTFMADNIPISLIRNGDLVKKS